MEYCKHCSKPILSDLENQIYCSSECWRESKSGSNVENSETDIEKKSTLYVWSSIISMFIGLFLLLMVTATVVNSEEVFLPLFTISAGVLVLVVLQNILSILNLKKLKTQCSMIFLAMSFLIKFYQITMKMKKMNYYLISFSMWNVKLFYLTQ